MAISSSTKAKAAATRHTAYWRQDWMTKVLSNGQCSFAKLLFMRIASFGENGCWMTNETICEEFNRSESTVRRAITSLWLDGHLIITGWNGHGRKMYAGNHPMVLPELERRRDAVLKKGRIKTAEEYRDKIRLRRHSPNPQK